MLLGWSLMWLSSSTLRAHPCQLANLVIVFWNGGRWGTRWSIISVAFLGPLLHRSPSFAYVYFTAFKSFRLHYLTSSSRLCPFAALNLTWIRCRSWTRSVQLFQLALSDQSFKPTQEDRMVVWVEVEGCCTCRIVMRYSFFPSLQTCGNKLFNPQ